MTLRELSGEEWKAPQGSREKKAQEEESQVHKNAVLALGNKLALCMSCAAGPDETVEACSINNITLTYTAQQQTWAKQGLHQSAR